jgi:hypothetical protein
MTDETKLEPAPPRLIDPALKGKMLPGIAGIAMFLLLMTLLNVFAALSNKFGNGVYKLGILALCTILVAGLLGLLKMRRWGHAIVLAGCALLAASYFYLFSRLHQSPFIIQGCFMLVFFLYLVRPEVRDRML